MKKGRIFVVSAPSGCGKTTICGKVLRRIRLLVPSVSVTTRPRRPSEKSKKDYYYISRESFKNEIKKGNLLEWEENFGHFYGTPKRFAQKKIEEGKNILLSIDVKGARKIRKKFPESILIFIKPPSLRELSRRLKRRQTDRQREIGKRLGMARKELKAAPKYNYIVVNNKLENAVNEVISIIKKELKGD